VRAIDFLAACLPACLFGGAISIDLVPRCLAFSRERREGTDATAPRSRENSLAKRESSRSRSEIPRDSPIAVQRHWIT